MFLIQFHEKLSLKFLNLIEFWVKFTYLKNPSWSFNGEEEVGEDETKRPPPPRGEIERTAPVQADQPFRFKEVPFFCVLVLSSFFFNFNSASLNVWFPHPCFTHFFCTLYFTSYGPDLLLFFLQPNSITFFLFLHHNTYIITHIFFLT